MKKSIIIALTVLTFIACDKKKEIKPAATGFVLSDSMQKMIALDSASIGNIDDVISLSGEVSYNENNVVKVFPRSSGQVIESKVTLGDKVTEGQIIATIKSADIAGSYADLSSSEADIAIAKRQMENTESLYKNGIASEKELTEAKQNYQKALATKRKIESVININGGKNTNQTGIYNLTAPINGFIVEKRINTGAFIRPDMGDYLFTISNLKDVWVNANVYEADIPKIKEGYNVKVTTLAYPDKVFTGTIDKLSEVLDPSNKALRVRVKLNNDQLFLKPQMFTRVLVSNEEKKKAITIPTSAIIQQDGKNFVVVFHRYSDMRLAEINIIKTVGNNTYINTGVQPGEKIIVKNQLMIFQQLIVQ